MLYSSVNSEYFSIKLSMNVANNEDFKKNLKKLCVIS